MYKSSQWPECERHKHFIHNECNALSCLHVHNICAKLLVSSTNIALVKCLLKQCSIYTTTTYQSLVPTTHTFNIQGSKYSILDVYSPLSKHNVFCSNGSEIPALTEVVTLEIDVCTTHA